MAQIYKTTLNGKQIFCKVARTSGGNKLASFDYPFQNKRYNQYLGVRPKDFTLNIIVFSDDLENPLDYETKKRELIEELETQQSCVLVHPFFGELIVDVADFSLVEEIASLGKCEFEVVFKEGTQNIYPIAGDFSKDNLVSKKTEFSDLQETNISKNLNKVSKFKQGFKKLKAKTNAVINKVNEQVDKVRAISAQINEVSAFITDFQTDINSILALPDQLAGNITGLINSITNLSTNPLDNILILKTLFGFGNDDQKSQIETRNNTFINENDNLINFAVQSLALANCYEVLGDVSFSNLDELEYYQSFLENQYKAILTNSNFASQISINTDNKENLNNDLFKSLGDLRNTANQYLKQVSLTLPDVQDYESDGNKPLIIFLYENYKNIDKEQDIIDLNKLENTAFMDETMQVLV